MMWFELNLYTHAHTHTKRPNLKGHVGYWISNWEMSSLGLMLLAYILYWSLFLSVCVCVVTWSVVAMFYMMWQKKMTNMWGDSLYLEKHPSGPLTVCWGYCKFWGFITLDGRQLTNNKLNNCELIKKSIRYILQLSSPCTMSWLWEEVSEFQKLASVIKIIFFVCFVCFLRLFFSFF